jgi:excisionase family DNA binding protein
MARKLPNSSPLFMTVQEVATLISRHVRTVDRLVKEGRLEKLEGARITRESVDRYLESVGYKSSPSASPSAVPSTSAIPSASGVSYSASDIGDRQKVVSYAEVDCLSVERTRRAKLLRDTVIANDAHKTGHAHAFWDGKILPLPDSEKALASFERTYVDNDDATIEDAFTFLWLHDLKQRLAKLQRDMKIENTTAFKAMATAHVKDHALGTDPEAVALLLMTGVEKALKQLIREGKG